MNVLFQDNFAICIEDYLSKNDKIRIGCEKNEHFNLVHTS